MFRRVASALLLKILLAALAGLLLAVWLPSLGIEVAWQWLLAGGATLAAGCVLLRADRRGRDVDLSASELTTLTFPPERRVRRPRRRH